jgi:UDP-N-acetylmuramate-alanine ligase
MKLEISSSVNKIQKPFFTFKVTQEIPKQSIQTAIIYENDINDALYFIRSIYFLVNATPDISQISDIELEFNDIYANVYEYLSLYPEYVDDEHTPPYFIKKCADDPNVYDKLKLTDEIELLGYIFTECELTYTDTYGRTYDVDIQLNEEEKQRGIYIKYLIEENIKKYRNNNEYE